MQRFGRETLPPPPTLPIPPAPTANLQQPLTADEATLTTHLQGIRQYGTLPPNMAAQLEALEQRHQEALNVRALSHAHLNKLHKARHQATTLADKINSVDSGRKIFLANQRTD